MDIPRRDWADFLDGLSRLHCDEPIRIEILREDIGAQLEVTELPLDGIVAELKEDASASITIAAGTLPDQHVAHVISDPVAVRIARGPGGDDDTLEIVSEDRTITLVFFDAPKGWSATR
jgi:hypothetical protein